MSDSWNQGEPGAVATKDLEKPKKGLRRGPRPQDATPPKPGVAAHTKDPHLPKKGLHQDDHHGHHPEQDQHSVPVSSTDRGLQHTLDRYRAKAAAQAPPPQLNQFRGLGKNAPHHQHEDPEEISILVPPRSANVQEVPLTNEEFVTTSAVVTERRSDEQPATVVSFTDTLTNNPVRMEIAARVPPVFTSFDIETGPQQTASASALLAVSTAGSSLLQANLVQDHMEIQDLPHAVEVDMAALHNQQADRQKRRRQKHIRLSIVTTTITVGIVALVFYVWLQGNGYHPPRSVAPSTSSPESSSILTHSPTVISEDLGVLNELPVTTQQNIGIIGTPQYYAWKWLQQYSNASGVNFTDSTTYPLERKKELFALATFYYAFEGPNWPELVRNDWLILDDPQRHECTWFNSEYTKKVIGHKYITNITSGGFEQCNEENYTRSIVLNDLELDFYQPSLPPEMSLLSSLRVVCLEFNGLSGNLTSLTPQGLGLFSNLTALSLIGNALTGTLPTEIGLLSSLEELYLISNSFTGTLPTEVGLWSNLKLFYINENALTGTIPTELGLLSNLEDVDLSDLSEGFSGTIPTELGLLSCLSYLAIYSDALTGALPTELGLLSSLYVLILYKNALTGTIPTELVLLSTVEDISLDENALTGATPTELGLLSTLTHFCLSSNALTGTLPTELGLLSNLRTFFLEKNSFTGSIPTELGLVSNLQWLYLGNNFFTGTLPSELGLLSNLRTFFLQKNSFTGSIPTELGLVSNLQWLSLGNNFFTGTLPSELGLLSSINDIDLANLPSLSGTIPTELEDCIYLSHLNMSGSTNLFGTIPDQLCTLQPPDFCSRFDVVNMPCVTTRMDLDCSDTKLCGCDCNCSSSSLLEG